MPTWGGRWGDRWGCPEPGENIYLALCQQFTWKQAEQWPNHKLVCEIAAIQAFDAHQQAERVERRWSVAGAQGDELDQYGAMVVFPRFGAIDTLYRKGIIAAGRALLGSGDPATFHDVIAEVNPNALRSLAEIFPACVRLTFKQTTEQEQAVIFGLLENVPGLGICLQRIVTFGDEIFQWAGDGIPVTRHWSDATSPTPITPSSETAGWAAVV